MIGRTLSHFEIVAKLGEGGMGEVYLAEDTRLKRKIALKVLPRDLADDPERLSRFRREAEALAALDHPNIVTVFSVEEDEGVHFLTMAYIEGTTLDELIPPDGLPMERFLELAIPLADALRAAHARGIIHRDLKPSNVMVDGEGRLRILDFGLAKLRREVEAPDASQLPTATMTQHGLIVGTVPYMSPEQLDGRSLDHRSDIFSLGVLLYEMASGSRPFAAEAVASLISSIVRDDPTPLSELRLDAPPRLGEIIGRCLAKDPAVRYQSAADLSTDLKAVQRAPDSTQVTSPPRGFRPGALAAVAAVLVLGLLAWLGVWSSGRQTVAPATTSREVSRPAEDTQPMIAVLPFRNLGPAEEEYFVAGITEEVTSRLARLSGLGVVSRTSADQYAETDKSVQQIGSELSADYLLEGSVRWARDPESGTRVRITPQLIRVADDIHIWSEPFDRVLEDIFAIQTEIAQRVADELGVAVLDQERLADLSWGTENLEAYQAYLRGRHYSGLAWVRGGTAESEHLARESFEKAIELDPLFARAYAGLALLHGTLYTFGYDRSPERVELGRTALDRASDLEPESPEIRMVRGQFFQGVYRDYERSLEEFMLAAEQLPNDARLQARLGSNHRRRGQWQAAAAYYRNAYRLDPRSSAWLRSLVDVYSYLRRHGEALRHAELVIALAPEAHSPLIEKARAYLRMGEVDRARAALEPVPTELREADVSFWLELYDGEFEAALEVLGATDDKWIGRPFYFRPKALLEGFVRELRGDEDAAHALYRRAAAQLEQEVREKDSHEKLESALGVTHAFLGQSEEALSHGRRAIELVPVSDEPYFGLVHVEDLAWIYTRLGDLDAAVENLAALLEIPSHLSVPMLELDPRWAPLRDHPGFRELIARHG